MFNASTKPTTTAILDSYIPNVFITSKALTQMKLYTDNCSDEIGWLGTAYKSNDVYVVDEMFLFKQEVHSTTTEINPEGLQEFAEDLLQKENGMDIWNNIKVWGHSHVNMDTFASGQDNDQMEVFSKVGHDWFIRIITNKKGSLKLDFYNYTNGIVFYDIDWEEYAPQNEIEIHNQINELYQRLQAFQDSRIQEMQDPIKAEILEKVKKKTYAYNYKYNANYNPKQIWKDGKWITQETNTQANQLTYDYATDSYWDDYQYGYNQLQEKPDKKTLVPVISSVFDYFDYKDLDELMEATDFESFKKKVNSKYDISFSHAEVLDFWEEIKIEKEFSK